MIIPVFKDVLLTPARITFLHDLAMAKAKQGKPFRAIMIGFKYVVFCIVIFKGGRK